MSENTRKIIIICASVVLVLALCSVAVLLLWDSDVIGGGETEPAETHAPEETIYDEDGNVKSIVYYEDNEYNGRRDFYTDNKTDYEMLFDKDGEEIESRKTEHNIMGSVTMDRKKVNGEVVELCEYDYYDDMTTLKKMTKKAYEGETENAEKIYYYENGETKQHCWYVDGELTEEKFFDEDGIEITPESSVSESEK